MAAKNIALSSEACDRIDRLIEISKKKGIIVELAADGSRVTLKNSKGEIIASRPVSDFADG